MQTRHFFERRRTDRFVGPADETCEHCGTDPRNELHFMGTTGPELPWPEDESPAFLSALYRAWRDAGGIDEATKNGRHPDEGGLGVCAMPWRQRVWWAVLALVERERPLLPEARQRITDLDKALASERDLTRRLTDDLEVSIHERNDLQARLDEIVRLAGLQLAQNRAAKGHKR